VTKSNGYGRGDQLVYLHIVIPKSLNEKQRNLMEELSKEFNDTNPKARKGFKDKFIEMFE
jgi:DnaJ-class molecular chaperone